MPRYNCQSCGAQLEVRVRFTGRLIWTINESNPDFSNDTPEPRGDFGSPRLSCSADPLHESGYRLVDGCVEQDLSSRIWD